MTTGRKPAVKSAGIPEAAVTAPVDVELPAGEGRNGIDTTPTEIGTLAELERALEADDRPMRRVTVDEWPGRPRLWLRGLSGTQRDEMEIAMSRLMGAQQYVFFDNAAAQMVARALCTPTGAPLIPKDQIPKMVGILGERQAGGLLRLHRVAQKLSGLSDADISELVDDLKDDPSASSGTD